VTLVAAGWLYFGSESSITLVERPLPPGVIIPTAIATSPPAVLKPTTEYEQMRGLVAKIIVRWHVLLSDGKIIKVPVGSGTGFVVARDGLIATNKHVVARGPEGRDKDWIVDWDVLVAFFGDDQPIILEGRVAHQSAYVDLATIRVNRQFADALGFAASPTEGDRVKVYGFPGVAEDLSEYLNERDARQREASITTNIKAGKEPDLLEWLGANNMHLVVTAGIVSAKRPTEKGLFLQTDAVINHGNSGGPMVNEQGLVMGMATLGLEGSNLCLSSRTIYEELTREPGIEWPRSW
jgi:S1-C subfamily serine protease